MSISQKLAISASDEDPLIREYFLHFAYENYTEIYLPLHLHRLWSSLCDQNSDIKIKKESLTSNVATETLKLFYREEIYPSLSSSDFYDGKCRKLHYYLQYWLLNEWLKNVMFIFRQFTVTFDKEITKSSSPRVTFHEKCHYT